MAASRRSNGYRVSRIGHRLLTVCLIVAAFGFAIVTPATGQAPTDSWDARTTEHSTIRFAPDLPELPDLAPDLFLANFSGEIDAAVTELALVLALEPAAIELQILPRIETGDVIAVDPVAGVIAIDGPVFTGQTHIDAVNLLRNGIARTMVSRASDGNLAPLFVSGMALYAQRPLTPVISRYAANLQNANTQGAMLSWADINRSASGLTPGTELTEASQYAVTAWLIDHFQLATYQQFLREMRDTDDWRVGIERAYGLPAAEIERQWREDVPRWANTGWKTNVLAGFDLDPARMLLERGNYAAAKASLERSQRLFSELGDEANLQVVTALLAQTEVGLQAETLMTQTEASLRQHDYERASDLIAQAEAQYARMPPDQRPEAVLADYRARADAGLKAIEQLANAQRLANSWTEFPQARNDAIAAGRAFAELSDATRLSEAETTLDRIDERVRRLVFLLGGLAFLSFVWLLLWRRHGGNTAMIWPEQVRNATDARRGA
jgi:hypothetical protein